MYARQLKTFFFFHSDKLKLEFVSGAFKTTPQVGRNPQKVSNGFHVPVDSNGEDDDFEGACALPLVKQERNEAPINIEEITQIETSKVLELFPNYGVGYIRRLLAHYENSSENVIAKILEGRFLSGSHYHHLI